MSEILTAPAAEQIDGLQPDAQIDYPDLVIQLTSMVETAWTLEGTEKDRKPIRLDRPGMYRIVPTSKVRSTLR